MARKLSNKTNVTAPDATYPYGKVKDNPGDNTGTPVNEALLGDMTQFFEKLMAATATAFNNQPENDVSGFQFYTALVAAIRATSASETQHGTVERATQEELNALTDTARYITPALIAGSTGIIDTAAIQDEAVTVSKRATDSVNSDKIESFAVIAAKMADDSIDSRMYIDGSIDDEHLAAKRVKIPDAGDQLSMISLESAVWNMDTTSFVRISFPSGVTISNLVGIFGFIKSATLLSTIGGYNVSTTNVDVAFEVMNNSQGITIVRKAGGHFDSPIYNNVTAVVTIVYIT